MIRQPSRADLMPYGERLFEPWNEYGDTVSPHNMTMSVWTAALLWWLCDETKATRVCDLGSGFSSYVLRRYAEGKSVEVVSVDDDDEWLARTGSFLTGHDMDDGALVAFSEWRDASDKFDVILHDLAGGYVREATMRTAVGRLNPGGAVIFDDAQNRSHHKHIAHVCAAADLVLLDVWEATLDAIDRFAALAVAP